MDHRPQGIPAHTIAAIAPRAACELCEWLGVDLCRAPCNDDSTTACTPAGLTQSSQTIRARRIVCRGRELTSVVPVICDGWAAANVMLPDGSRQIISFLLPGDIISMALLFESTPSYFVEAITDVRCRIFNRSELKSLLFGRAELLNKLCTAWVEEKSRADELIIDLGRRGADERVARLILNVAGRLASRGLVRQEPMEFDFPLRQYHIGDAIGLTSVHVSKVLSDFRRRGLIRITNRSLAVLDPAGLRRVASIR